MASLAAADFPDEALTIVLFGAGGLRLGVEARQVRASRPAAVGEDTLAVETLLALPTRNQAGARYALSLRFATGEREVLVDGPLEITGFLPEAIYPLPPLLAARTSFPGLRAVALNGGASVLLFDLAGLIEASQEDRDSALS